ncbi:endonuclease III, partial [Patescibacteria group bacterium]|nr:endonuclease III [Patescibacteria group bacterium]
GFYRNKAKNIIAAAKKVLKDYDGKLPRTLAELQKIPGVGRKTANVVLSNLYNIHEGIAIDTHAIRISRKFDLVDPPYSPVSIERDLMEITPKTEWRNMNHYLVLYGRYHAPAHAREVHDELTAIYPKASYKLTK